MTKEDGYNNWMWAARDHCYSNQDIWNAACDWQKAQDASLIYDKNKRYHPYGECYEADVRQECSGEIING